MGSLPRDPRAARLDDDRALLKRLDDLADEDHCLDSTGADMLEDMMGQVSRGGALTDRQRAWAQTQIDRLLGD